ncbi:MAG TPA: VOC family protein [Jatrophihabitantaceae bacterium]|jgi:predicted enzyme related to lactoylglutathione lyase|nr:VOC family protein [Jatrophihabitantaceae bacterium]
MTMHVIDRNGHRHGDLSYLTIAAADPARAEAFYGALLGWAFGPGRYGRDQGLQVIPQIGIYDGVRPDGSVARGTLLCYRVRDIASAVERVRAGGGRASDPVERAYGLESLCTDNQAADDQGADDQGADNQGADDQRGTDFYLHELGDSPAPSSVDLTNGRQHGDAAYFTLGVSDLARAEQFYGSVLGWTFQARTVPNGRQIDGVTPMGGLWQDASGVHGESPWRGATIAYRVDDIEQAVRRVRELGGTADAAERRPYGLASDHCVDDQGLRFSLLELG